MNNYIETRTELELLQKDEQALLVEIKEFQSILAVLEKDLAEVRLKIQKEYLYQKS